MPDRLAERFADLAEDVQGRILPVSAAGIRARSSWSRQLRVVLSVAVGVAALSTGVLSMSFASGVDGDGPSPDTTTLPNVIPDALRMPHEGEAGWARDDDPSAAGAVNPCGGEDVTLAGRVDAITMTGPGRPGEEEHSPAGVTVQLLLFRDGAAAHTAWQRLADAMPGCDWGGGPVTGMVYGETTLMGRWPFSSTPASKTKEVLVVQRTSALILRYAEIGGAHLSGGDNEGFYELSTQLCTTMGLCERQGCWVPYGGYPPTEAPDGCEPSTPGGHPIGSSSSGSSSSGASHPGGSGSPIAPASWIPSLAKTPSPSPSPGGLSPSPSPSP